MPQNVITTPFNTHGSHVRKNAHRRTDHQKLQTKFLYD